MMRRRFLCGVAASLIAGASAARAETLEERIVAQLSREGYRRISVRRTFLGRIRITASGARGTREIVLNPSTGAVLRDYVDRDDDARDDRGDTADRDDDDRDEDDDRDDDRDDDKDDDRDDDDRDDNDDRDDGDGGDDDDD